MRLTRRSRFLSALLALFCMLCMQLALASYACPGQSIGGNQASQALSPPAADHAMANCADMDPEEPVLCHAYDQADNQSLDKPQFPSVQPFIATGLLVQLAEVDYFFAPDGLLSARMRPIQGNAPPIAIRHCCLRI